MSSPVQIRSSYNHLVFIIVSLTPEFLVHKIITSFNGLVGL